MRGDDHQLVALYFGAAGCGPCHDGRLKGALAVLKTRLSTTASALGATPHLIGVSLDADVDTGLAFLRASASFDEFVVGGGMMRNTAAARYLVAGPPGYLGIPQLVVQERVLRSSGSRIEVVLDREISRYLGSATIAAWVEAGAPLPRTSGQGTDAAAI